MTPWHCYRFIQAVDVLDVLGRRAPQNNQLRQVSPPELGPLGPACCADSTYWALLRPRLARVTARGVGLSGLTLDSGPLLARRSVRALGSSRRPPVPSS